MGVKPFLGKIIMKKSILCLLTICFLILPLATAYNVNYNRHADLADFYTNVYQCSDSSCSSISNGRSIYSGGLINSFSLTGTGNDYYSEYNYKACYKPEIFIIHVWDPLSGTSNQYMTFDKVPNCEAKINSATVSTNNIKLGQTIKITANLDSAFEYHTAVPTTTVIPNEIKDNYSSSSRLIIKANGTKIGEVNDKVLLSSNKNFEFDWVPTQPGDYDITIESEVTDCACSSNVTRTVNIGKVIVNTTQCSDGLDNDGDKLIDLADTTDCPTAQDDTENIFDPGNTLCSNGLDDDSDGYIDLADPDCNLLQDDTETNWDPGNTQCSNGIDDDSDGYVDTADLGCINQQDNNEYNNLNPVIVSNPTTTAYPDFDYEYDVNAIDPNNDPITYWLIQGPSGMTINTQSGLIQWEPTKKQEGKYYIIIEARDDKQGSIQQGYYLIVDYPSVEIYPRRKTFIEKIRMNRAVYEFVKPGEDLFIDTSFENMGVYDVKKATIRATVPELGISRKIGPFTGPEVKKGLLKQVPLIIPEDAQKGVYTLRLTITTDKQLKRVRHRDFRVI